MLVLSFAHFSASSLFGWWFCSHQMQIQTGFHHFFIINIFFTKKNSKLKCASFEDTENTLSGQNVTDEIERTCLAPYPLQNGNWPWWNNPSICKASSKKELANILSEIGQYLSYIRGFWYFMRSQSRKIQVNPRNPTKFTKTHKIPQNAEEILSNTCLYSNFETCLSYGGIYLP